MESKELKEILTAQREIYIFLSKIITTGPQQDLLNHFIHTYRNIVKDEDTESDDLIDGIIAINKALGNNSIDSDGSILMAALKSEYTRLFIGPGKIPVPPYASVYLSKETNAKLMDEKTIEIRKQYLEDNIVMTKLNAVPDDFLGAELEYMSYLTNRSIEAIEKQDTKGLKEFLKKQSTFLQNHLLFWIPKFSKDLISSTKEDFFKGLAVLLRGLVKSHYHIVREIHDSDYNLSNI